MESPPAILAPAEEQTRRRQGFFGQTHHLLPVVYPGSAGPPAQLTSWLGFPPGGSLTVAPPGEQLNKTISEITHSSVVKSLPVGISFSG